MAKQSLEIAELFAGVGGFRLGLEKSGHKTVWANQWEPKTKVQHAYDCYKRHFGDFPDLNTDIHMVDKSLIPDHNLLVGGFPCQDYSVATTRAKGIQGHKGVLWWDIRDVFIEKKPRYMLLENVDRLLKSPVSQRGRDFGVILSCLLKDKYCVEWRVINAADYGFPQKRRRVFIFAAKTGSMWYDYISRNVDKSDYLEEHGFFSNEFKVEDSKDISIDFGSHPDSEVSKNVQMTSDKFNYSFQNSGVMFEGMIWTRKVIPKKTKFKTLKSILMKGVDDKYYIPKSDIEKWEYLKGAKKEKRIRKDGSHFYYTEGSIPFPDNLEQPARTIITSEGGLTPSRFKHLIEDPWEHRLRLLTPVEVEKINGFRKNWTMGMPENWRYFCMGNALVVGLIEKMGKILAISKIR